MEKNIENFDLEFDFTPIGLARKKASEAKGITREQIISELGKSSVRKQLDTLLDKLEDTVGSFP